MRKLISAVILGAALTTLGGCVYTNAAFQPAAIQSGAMQPAAAGAPASAKARENVMIVETDIADRPYRIIGEVEGYGRAVNLLSSDPTRADVDEALRAEAAKHGADAVIQVKYAIERTGLASRGLMTAKGRAVVFTP